MQRSNASRGRDPLRRCTGTHSECRGRPRASRRSRRRTHASARATRAPQSLAPRQTWPTPLPPTSPRSPPPPLPFSRLLLPRSLMRPLAGRPVRPPGGAARESCAAPTPDRAPRRGRRIEALDSHARGPRRVRGRRRRRRRRAASAHCQAGLRTRFQSRTKKNAMSFARISPALARSRAHTCMRFHMRIRAKKWGRTCETARGR